MTQSEIDEAVAAATNESLPEIRRRGFSMANQEEIDEELEPPRIVDWDELDSHRLGLFP